MKRFLVFLLSFSLPAGAALVPGAESAVNTPQRDIAAFDQADGLIASDGETFLAVWTDSDIQGRGDIHASRVSAEGARVDDTPLFVATTSEPEDRPSLAWGSDRYLVVWSTPAALRARFVARDGAASPVISIATVTGTTKSHVAFNGRVFLVLWEAAGLQIRGAIIDPAGTIVKTFDVASSEGTYLDTALVAAGGTFYYATAKIDLSGIPTGNGYPADVGVLPIGEDGTIGTRIVAAPALSPVFDLDAAARGDELLVAWTTTRGIPGAEIRSVRVTAAGAGPLDAFAANDRWLQQVVAEPSGYVLVYGDERTHFGARSGDGSGAFSIASPATLSTVSDGASNGTRVVLVTRGMPRSGFEYGPAGGDLYLQRLDADLARPLSIAERHQQSPDIATAEETGVRLAVWCEYIGSDRRLGVMASRIAADGRTLDAAGIDLGANVYHPVSPRVASDGENWLVVWRDLKSVYGMRIARNGTRLDPQPFVIAADVFEQSDVAVSWDEARYLVVFLRGQFQRGLRTTVTTAYVLETGLVQTPELALSTVGANETPTIASDIHRSLVVWYSAPKLQGALLAGGAITPIAFPTIAAAQRRPSVAENDQTFLVATPTIGPWGTRVEWLVVDHSGNVSAPQTEFVPIQSDPSNAATYGFAMVELEADGPNFLLYFNGVAPVRDTRDTTIRVARINERGQLLDVPVVIATTVADYAPNFGASGRTVTYARKLGLFPREVMRAFWRELTVVPKAAKRRSVR